MYTVPRVAISRSVASSTSTACSSESAPARTASRAPLAPYEWIAIFFPYACAVSVAAFISSNVKVWLVLTLSNPPHGSEHLDHVGAGSDLFAHGLHHFGGTTGLAAGRHEHLADARCATRDVQAVTGAEDPGPDHRPTVDQIAHREVGVFLRTEIADRGEAGFERLARVLLGHEHPHRRRQSHAGLQRTHAGARTRVGPIGDVRVVVDQPGDPVQPQRSTTRAPAGIAEVPLPTDFTRSP